MESSWSTKTTTASASCSYKGPEVMPRGLIEAPSFGWAHAEPRALGSWSKSLPTTQKDPDLGGVRGRGPEGHHQMSAPQSTDARDAYPENYIDPDDQQQMRPACRVCGHPLTAAKSVARLIGPKCRRREGAA
ncbi:DUF6011 domain-containing protein [Gordonia sp. 'Campus']|uniref:DUF6011 domain-containing protein n=1 Tax=Gordonia sp. 'Campus' TaxID=2915824 RepID=UPI0035B4EB10